MVVLVFLVKVQMDLQTEEVDLVGQMEYNLLELTEARVVYMEEEEVVVMLV